MPTPITLSDSRDGGRPGQLPVVHTPRPFLTREAADLLVQVLVIFRLDYRSTPLAGPPAAAIRPSQRRQRATACLLFNQPRFSHVTPLQQSLHWLPVSAHIKFQTPVLTDRAGHQTAIDDQIPPLLLPPTVPLVLPLLCIMQD